MQSFILIPLRWCVFFCTSLLILSLGCGGSKGDFPVASTRGTVETTEGVVLQYGKVKFTPVPDDPKAQAGKPAFGRIIDGEFVLSTYGNGDGAVVGEHTVMLLEGRQPDPDDADAGKGTRHNCELAQESQSVEITAGENVIKLIAVPKKRKRGQREEEEDD